MSVSKLLTVTPYGEGGASSRVRVFDWIDHFGLDAERSEYLGLSLNSPGRLAARPRQVLAAESRLRQLEPRARGRIVLMSKMASPFSRGRIEERLLVNAARGVYDFDDSLFYTNATGLRRAGAKATMWAKAVSAADVVVAGNDYLASKAVDIAGASNVVVIPSCIEPDHYVHKSRYGVQTIPRAVWVGSPGTEPYLGAVAPALLRVNEITGLRLTVVSSGDRDLGSLRNMTDRVEWSPESASDEMSKADIGIMPLPDNPWTRGKCAYKLLQYAAAGLPCVGSPVGVNEQVLSRIGGHKATSQEEWAGEILRFLDMNPKDLSLVGSTMRDRVRDNYSYKVWGRAWRTAVLGDADSSNVA